MVLACDSRDQHSIPCTATGYLGQVALQDVYTAAKGLSQQVSEAWSTDSGLHYRAKNSLVDILVWALIGYHSLSVGFRASAGISTLLFSVP